MATITGTPPAMPERCVIYSRDGDITLQIVRMEMHREINRNATRVTLEGFTIDGKEETPPRKKPPRIVKLPQLGGSSASKYKPEDFTINPVVKHARDRKGWLQVAQHRVNEELYFKGLSAHEVADEMDKSLDVSKQKLDTLRETLALEFLVNSLSDAHGKTRGSRTGKAVVLAHANIMLQRLEYKGVLEPNTYMVHVIFVSDELHVRLTRRKQ